LRVLHIVLSIRIRSMRLPTLSRPIALPFITWIGLCFPLILHAQRLTIPESSTALTSSSPSIQPASQQEGQVLKTYPDGTKRVVPLSSLNFRDDGNSFGGPPTLSFLEPSPIQSSSSNKNLSIAPIGDATTPATTPVTIPSAADSTIQIPMANPDPMGGSAMGGSAPVDPLSGAPTTPTPLQTVSGKPAPLSDGGAGTTDLGTYDDFFMNASVGGSIQGQLTARRVYNGNNMQAYPLTIDGTILGFPAAGNVTAENFTFQPGFRFDTQFGYNIYDWLGVALESGVIYNALQNYTVSVDGTISLPNAALTGSGTYTCPADGELIQVPIQFSAIARWPGATAFKPFIGGGIGAIWQQLDVNSINIAGTDVQANYCRSAFQFGFNGQLGANYTVTPGVDFYGAFKLLGVFTPRIGNYDFENSYNFALEVGIQSRF
jgi:hypothetical protein